MVESKSTFPVVIAGPSGAGKTTLAREVVRKLDHCRFSVSDTSRPRRGRERPGVDYNFVDVETFKMKIETDAYAEWAIVHGDHYGTPRSEVDGSVEDGKIVILDIDVQGSAKIRKYYPDSVGIFVVPPSLSVLERRLRGRGTEEEDRIQRRLEDAMRELDRMFEYDYIVINDTFDGALQDTLSILRVETLRASRLNRIKSL